MKTTKAATGRQDLKRAKRPALSTTGWLTAAAGIVCCLLPAIAWASGDGGGEHHGPNWFSLAGSVVNFIVLVGLLVYFGRPKLQQYLADRKKNVEEEIVEAESLLGDARTRLEEVKAKADRLESDIDALIAEYTSQGEAEKQRIIDAATNEAKRIVRDAELVAANEASRAQKTMRDEIVEAAMTQAKQTLNAEMNAAHQQALVDRYITSLGSMSSEASA